MFVESMVSRCCSPRKKRNRKRERPGKERKTGSQIFQSNPAAVEKLFERRFARRASTSSLCSAHLLLTHLEKTTKNFKTKQTWPPTTASCPRWPRRATSRCASESENGEKENDPRGFELGRKRENAKEGKQFPTSTSTLRF